MLFHHKVYLKTYFIKDTIFIYFVLAEKQGLARLSCSNTPPVSVSTIASIPITCTILRKFSINFAGGSLSMYKEGVHCNLIIFYST